ncbi:AEC family transporter [Synechococcus sp. Nb3U1]|uniref:AEC family transporter n=1 Tax=Synechococcus sp. Nb3U1 TaxID=1914529 RepID=UPI001F2521EB|nr:AEC family transporter [Synechococcus sp. Nb3U1]MCF2970969.1 AEC family transporter [Synechococcus sp. Nb3U1]
MFTTLFQVYSPLLGWTILGFLLQKVMPTGWNRWVGPHPLGRFMFWVGVPLSIIGFMQGVDLSGQIWVAPLICWLSVGLGAGMASAWLWWQHLRREGLAPTAPMPWSSAQQGSFHLAATLGNTGYLGYPICLAVAGTTYFGWALFYDLLGTLFMAYGFGVWVASRYGNSCIQAWQVGIHILRTPALWSFGMGLLLVREPPPGWLSQGLSAFAWGMIPLSLMLLGMRLAQVKHWGSFRPAGVALLIKLLLVPLLVGIGLAFTSYPPLAKLVLVLQSGMPPAIATLVLTEEYDLDREITVTALAVGYLAVLLTLPLWLKLWGA